MKFIARSLEICVWINSLMCLPEVGRLKDCQLKLHVQKDVKPVAQPVGYPLV